MQLNARKLFVRYQPNYKINIFPENILIQNIYVRKMFYVSQLSLICNGGQAVIVTYSKSVIYAFLISTSK